MERDDYNLVVRAAHWFGGKLSPTDKLAGFSMNVLGPRDDSRDAITTYHTFACFYPDRGLYIAADTSRGAKPGDWRVDALQIREVINGFVPPAHHVAHQRQLAAEAMPGSTAAMRWSTALLLGAMYDLPVAVLAFGHTPANELVVYQQSIVIAPLIKVAETLKLAAPRINLN